MLKNEFMAKIDFSYVNISGSYYRIVYLENVFMVSLYSFDAA